VLTEFFWQPIRGQPRRVDTNELRQFSQTFWVNACVTTILDEITTMDWDIVAKEDYDYNAVKESIQQVKEFLKYPNKNRESFIQILRALLKDILEIDAGVLVKVFDLGSYDFDNLEPKSGAPILKEKGQRKMTEIYARDGSSFLKEVDKFGFVKGYFQYSYQIPAHPMWFNKEEICYVARNTRSMSCYGYAPTQAVLDIIKSLHYSTLYNKRFFEENSIPDGVLSLLDTNPTEMKNFADNWVREFQAQPHKFAVVNKDIKWQAFNISNRELEFLETQSWYFKLIISAFGLTPAELGITEDLNKATAATQAELSRRKGIRPLLKLLEQYINEDIIDEFGIEGVEFQFIYDDPAEKSQRLNNWQIELNMGIKSVNEIREEMGLDPVDWGEGSPSKYAMGTSGIEGSQTEPGSEPTEKPEIKAEASSKTQEEGIAEKGKISKFIPKGRNCDRCGQHLEEEDYDRSGSWNYTCPKCGFRYIHGMDLDEEDDEDTEKGAKEQEAIADFEYMRDMAELRALSKISLERPLNDEEYERMNELAEKVGLKKDVDLKPEEERKKESEKETNELVSNKSLEIADEKIKGIAQKENIPFEDLKEGVKVETEHADTVDNNEDTIIGIALDHIKEDPKYYTKLKEVEKEIEKALSSSEKNEIIDLIYNKLKTDLYLIWQRMGASQRESASLANLLGQRQRVKNLKKKVKKGVNDGQYYTEPNLPNAKPPSLPKRELKESKNKITCPSCGKNVLANESDFADMLADGHYHCLNCGASISEDDLMNLHAIETIQATPQGDAISIPNWSPKSIGKSTDINMDMKEYAGFDYKKSWDETEEYIDSEEYRSLLNDYLTNQKDPKLHLKDEDIQKIIEILRTGLKEELSVADITRDLSRFIEDKDRAELIARTETIRVVNQGNIKMMEAGGAEKAKWIAAPEDGRLCEECKKLDGQIFTITEIQNKIPLHPRCRCSSVPVY
jgi:SPP1 gp7 family putative phage head morphogenesis protein